ncbi:unnamed protein product, partial [Brassica rapa]
EGRPRENETREGRSRIAIEERKSTVTSRSQGSGRS